ncbi:hypothetical protein [Actinacidiphila sp. ITFR-21]|uniref:hypothetical protein n=1 Tax=Actinacidiphila sp. ITFR-21 TaxID=3075199 RepID=UPI00288B161F|nr:hypothetical protein [Streptomyces sp. ITFR-21]WNI17596.1 hypothetical protein RLT57_20115 [Streptomyces sp. ITFR-21]WNI17736.1 hypothetical protein RLT57_20830 [Streptomyces sp. ITFR-21]
MPEEHLDSTAPETRPLPFDPVIPTFREWAILKAQQTELTTRMNKLRDSVASAVQARGYADHKGSQYIDLPFPIPVGDTEYVRIKRERRVSIVADLEAAERITKARGETVYHRAFPPVPTLDADELYVLLQEGALTEEDMDQIMVQKESWAFRGLTT